jgi:phosphoglycerate dehydrogenase-like enzyme
MERLLAESDFVSLHVRLNESTQAMIGARELAMMKPSAFLIDTARRELLDDHALVAAIREQRIAGVAVDDPPTDITRELAGLPNVIFAPHHGNRAIEGVNAVFRLAVDNVVQILSGHRCEFVVNPEVYSGAPRLSTLS